MDRLISETVGAWLVFMRCAGCGFKSLKLLETAWTVFCREKPADVSELRIGGRGSSLHNIRGRFYKLRGYHIYYERNQMMQDYMIMRKDVRRVETGTGEPVVRDFRQRMEENKSQITSRRGSIRVLGSLCSALAMVVLAGGVVMVNNYDKMQKMESVLTSVLPEGISWQNSLSAVENSQKKGGSLRNSQTGQMSGTENGGDNLLVEHASGGVNPTPAHETMSETYPETAGRAKMKRRWRLKSRTGSVGMTSQTGKGRQRPKIRQARTSPPVMVLQVQRPRHPRLPQSLIVLPFPLPWPPAPIRSSLERPFMASV